MSDLAREFLAACFVEDTEIDLWKFTECDTNRDVKVSDLLHFAGIKVQVKHTDHLFRIYIKKIGDKTICRVEEMKNLGMSVVEAISHIFNPYDRVERDSYSTLSAF